MTDDGKVKILIVDDKPEKILALEAVLEELGQVIVRAYSGREALRALLNQDFAVILLDVNMPGMDGFETAQLIRQRKSTEHVPIIFVTAFGDENHTARGYQLGAVDYIETPVVREVLRTKVSVFVDLYKKTQQVQQQAEWQRRRAAQLQKLAAASLAINGAMSVEKILQAVTNTARDLVGSHQAITLYLIGPAVSQRPPRTQSFTSFSDKYADWRKRPLNLDIIATTAVACSHAATRMSEAELRQHPDWEIVSGVKIPPVHGGMLAAPLVSRAGTNLGVTYLCDRYEGPFTHDDEAVLTQLAQMASVAVENIIFSEERETNRIKDEFLSTLSHELRTPLNAILGWTQLLQAGPMDEETAHAIEVIERNARAQAKLVEDLLDISRVTTGKLHLNMRPIRFAAVVAAAVDAIRPMAEEQKLSMTFNADIPNEDTIVGDPDRLQQVVSNLLNNAVKFTPSDGKVEVRLTRANGGLRLTVTDTGRGIPPSFLPQVFDRFRQADATSTRSHGGLGIGLTIVRHIVELHGGQVHAESAGEGYGATFSVTIPVTQPAEAVTNQPIIGKANGAKRTDLTGVNVVVVDDEPDARDVVSRVLARAGARTTVAGSVREALAAIAAQRPDVVVSDIAMPDEDGYDLIRALRDRSLFDVEPIPALALTAYAREEDRLRCVSSGFQAHLAKPVDPSELLAIVGRLAETDASEQAQARRTG
jgi:signal transduction histidine kinase/DNA-binding response OmpR family regulator